MCRGHTHKHTQLRGNHEQTEEELSVHRRHQPVSCGCWLSRCGPGPGDINGNLGTCQKLRLWVGSRPAVFVTQLPCWLWCLLSSSAALKEHSGVCAMHSSPEFIPHTHGTSLSTTLTVCAQGLWTLLGPSLVFIWLWKVYLCYWISASLLWQVNVESAKGWGENVTSPILWMRKLRTRDAQDHVSSRWWNKKDFRAHTERSCHFTDDWWGLWRSGDVDQSLLCVSPPLPAASPLPGRAICSLLSWDSIATHVCYLFITTLPYPTILRPSWGLLSRLPQVPS